MAGGPEDSTWIEETVDMVKPYPKPQPEPELARILSAVVQDTSTGRLIYNVPSGLDPSGKPKGWIQLTEWQYPVYVFGKNVEILTQKIKRYGTEIERIKRDARMAESSYKREDLKMDKAKEDFETLRKRYELGLQTREFTVDSDEAKSYRDAILAAKVAIPNIGHEASIYFGNYVDIDDPASGPRKYNMFELIKLYEGRIDPLKESLRANRQWQAKAEEAYREVLNPRKK